MGANLGAAERTLTAALANLRRALGPLEVAPLYRSAPLSPISQPSFLNTVALARTALPPDAVLGLAKAIERAAGRERGERWGPRLLDVDLLLWGDRVCAAPELTLPHPGLRRRRFVLAPLADLAPDLAVPPDGRTVVELLAALGDEAEVERLAWSLSPGDAGPR